MLCLNQNDFIYCFILLISRDFLFIYIKLFYYAKNKTQILVLQFGFLKLFIHN